MPKKKTEDLLEDAEEIKSEKLKEIINSEEKPSEEKGRAEEDDYFFPDERVTIKATSLQEARAKLEKRK